MWKLFIWGIILGICGLGNFQFSAEFNIYEIENQKIMHRSPLFDFRPVKFSSKLHRKVVQFFYSNRAPPMTTLSTCKSSHPENGSFSNCGRNKMWFNSALTVHDALSADNAVLIVKVVVLIVLVAVL